MVCFNLSETNRFKVCLKLKSFYKSLLMIKDSQHRWVYRGGLFTELKVNKNSLKKNTFYFLSLTIFVFQTRIKFTMFSDVFNVCIPLNIYSNNNSILNSCQFRLYNKTSDGDLTRIIKNQLFQNDSLVYDTNAIDIYLEHSTRYCYIVENKHTKQIYAILLAALNVNYLNKIYKIKYFNEYQARYPFNDGDHRVSLIFLSLFIKIYFKIN